MVERVETQADLEDVLSSIRRLVSQNAETEKDDTLVLTDDQRVEVIVTTEREEPVLTAAAPILNVEGRLRPTPQPHPNDAPKSTKAIENEILDLAEAEVLTSAEDHFEAKGVSEKTEDSTKAESTILPLDEAELRELVVDIVRDELRGSLGQKITRNVRKLVRQEIQRAVNAKTLD